MPDTTPTTDRQAAVRAIHALKFPPPPGSQHYQAGWDTGLEAAIEAVQGSFEAGLTPARQVLGTTDQQPATAPAGTELRDRIAQALDNANHTYPCPATGSTYWTGCYHPDGTGPSCHTDRRTAAVLSVLPAPTDRAVCTGECDPATGAFTHAPACPAASGQSAEAHRLALSDALGLGTGAPWDAIRDRAAELHRMADEAQQPTCTCGEPDVSGTVHRTDSPCYIDEAQQPECTSAPCLHPGTCRHGCRAAADELSREAQQPETEATPQCTAGLLSATDAAVDRCVRRGKHDSHVTAAGARWGNGSEDEEPEDESCGRFVPDAPRAPGLCASCGDARGWHSLEAVGEQPKTEALCGKTIGVGLPDNPYRPCARPAGHTEAYCRDATEQHYFLAAKPETEAAK